jgi:hypothetical protein
MAFLRMGKETPDVPSETVCDTGRQLPDETIEERRERFAREGREAMADYRAAEAALRDRTKELRAMRQAQEANSSPLNGGASNGPVKKGGRRRRVVAAAVEAARPSEFVAISFGSLGWRSKARIVRRSVAEEQSVTPR